jgi:hypothetical protein
MVNHGKSSWFSHHFAIRHISSIPRHFEPSLRCWVGRRVIGPAPGARHGHSLALARLETAGNWEIYGN